MALTRRQLLSLVGSLPLTVAGARHAWTQTAGRVVVVGGGFGGATCAKYLRRADATLDVTLVEPHPQFMTCPFSVSVQQSALSFQQAPGESSSPRVDGIEGCTEELHHDVCHDARRTTAQSAHAATAARYHWRAGGTVAS